MHTRIRHLLTAGAITALVSACSAAPGTPATTSPVAASPSTSASSPAPSASPPLPPVPTAAPLATGRNGLIVYSDKAGDIHSLDPRTGSSKLIIGGKHNDIGPGMLPDNKHFVFVRIDEDMLYSAAVDGSGLAPYADARKRSSWEISPDGTRIAQIAEGQHTVSIVRATGGTGRVLDLGIAVDSVSWAGNDLLLVVDENADGAAVGMWTVRADGSRLTPLTTPELCCDGNTFAAGGLITWNSWQPGKDATVHVMDAATGADALLPSSDVTGATFFGPHFSPDGRWIAVSLFGGGQAGHQLALLRPDGTGSAMRLGPPIEGDASGFRTVYSPDGTQLLAVYDDGTSWLFDLPSGTGARTSWPSMLEATWQRLS